LYLRYNRLFSPRVTFTPSQTRVVDGFLWKMSGMHVLGEVPSPIKMLSQTAITLQVLLSWDGVSLNPRIQHKLSHFFFQINRQIFEGFKWRHKTNTRICNPTNQVLLNQKSLDGLMKGYPCFERSWCCGCKRRLWHTATAAGMAGLTEAQRNCCGLARATAACALTHNTPWRGSDRCNCFLVI